MKAFADIVAGLWSALCIATEVAWDYGVKFWNSRSETQKSVLLAVVIIVVALSVARVASAENTPGSNFGIVNSLSTPGTALACYISDGSADMTPGIVHTCLVLQAVGPGVLAVNGQVTFCTMTGTHKGNPAWSCGKYNDMAKLAGGI